jgi:CRP/FNR family transcriptional regulator
MNYAQFSLTLTRADLADFLGLTLETVSRQITKLKTAGVIELIDNREIVVPNIEVLEEIAGC